MKKNLAFQIVSADIESAGINSFSKFNEGSVCDMCWGDLSL